MTITHYAVVDFATTTTFTKYAGCAVSAWSALGTVPAAATTHPAGKEEQSVDVVKVRRDAPSAEGVRLAWRQVPLNFFVL